MRAAKFQILGFCFEPFLFDWLLTYAVRMTAIYPDDDAGRRLCRRPTASVGLQRELAGASRCWCWRRASSQARRRLRLCSCARFRLWRRCCSACSAPSSCRSHQRGPAARSPPCWCQEGSLRAMATANAKLWLPGHCTRLGLLAWTTCAVVVHARSARMRHLRCAQSATETVLRFQITKIQIVWAWDMAALLTFCSCLPRARALSLCLSTVLPFFLPTGGPCGGRACCADGNARRAVVRYDGPPPDACVRLASHVREY